VILNEAGVHYTFDKIPDEVIKQRGRPKHFTYTAIRLVPEKVEIFPGREVDIWGSEADMLRLVNHWNRKFLAAGRSCGSGEQWLYVL
jgi:hypothetical protein